MRNHQRRPLHGEIEMILRDTREEKPRAEADVTPDPAAPLDEMDVRPLTDPADTKGG
jgi:hypothetical protein